MTERNPYHKPAGTPEGGQFTSGPGSDKFMSAVREGAGLSKPLSKGLSGLTNPTPTDIARNEMPIPEEVLARKERDKKEGVGWRYEPLPALDKPENVVTLLVSDRERQGNCYLYASRLVDDNDGWELVHGNLFPTAGPFQDMPYNHAWAEKGNILYEPVFNKFFNKAEYYKKWFPVDIRRYNKFQMWDKMLETETYGDWE